MDDDLTERIREFDRVVIERDQDAARAVLDDDYALVLVQPSPARMPRDRWLEVLPDYVVHDYAVEELVVEADGDAAAVLQRVRMQATVLGEDRSGTLVISDHWRRRADGWRVWRRHSTPLTAGRMPGA
jgi:ketosteroid isomerase-like protein